MSTDNFLKMNRQRYQGFFPSNRRNECTESSDVPEIFSTIVYLDVPSSRETVELIETENDRATQNVFRYKVEPSISKNPNIVLLQKKADNSHDIKGCHERERSKKKAKLECYESKLGPDDTSVKNGCELGTISDDISEISSSHSIQYDRRLDAPLQAINSADSEPDSFLYTPQWGPVETDFKSTLVSIIQEWENENFFLPHMAEFLKDRCIQIKDHYDFAVFLTDMLFALKLSYETALATYSLGADTNSLSWQTNKEEIKNEKQRCAIFKKRYKGERLTKKEYTNIKRAIITHKNLIKCIKDKSAKKCARCKKLRREMKELNTRCADCEEKIIKLKLYCSLLKRQEKKARIEAKKLQKERQKQNSISTCFQETMSTFP